MTDEQADRVTIAEAEELSRRALRRAGASAAVADVMALALARAEAEGLAGVGLAHVVTYCEALAAGRIDGQAEPEISRPAPAVIAVDARGGVGHLGFERAFETMRDTARAEGVAVFSQKNSFTNAALGWFVWRLATKGLVALAATNGGPALLAGSGAREPVFCTNPMAFAVPRGDGPPLVIDQSSSATAYVNLRLAAEAGEPIPEGWALDADGQPTTDAAAALDGVLLPFGGARGGNVALMVELLAAGLSGANFSLDAPSFLDGEATPGIGLFVLAIDPARTGGDGFADRIGAYLDRIASDYGVYVPGAARAEAADAAERDGLRVPSPLIKRIRELAGA